MYKKSYIFFIFKCCVRDCGWDPGRKYIYACCTPQILRSTRWWRLAAVTTCLATSSVIPFPGGKQNNKRFSLDSFQKPLQKPQGLHHSPREPGGALSGEGFKIFGGHHRKKIGQTRDDTRKQTCWHQARSCWPRTTSHLPWVISPSVSRSCKAQK